MVQFVVQGYLVAADERVVLLVSGRVRLRESGIEKFKVKFKPDSTKNEQNKPRLNLV